MNIAIMADIHGNHNNYHIDVNAEMILTYVFKDSHTVERKWDTKRHMPKWSAERRAQ